VVEVTRPPGGSIASFEQLKSLFPANYEFLAFKGSQRQSLNGKYELVDFAPLAAEFFKSGDHRNLVAVPAEKMSVVPRSKK
jgi:hypothetical protein